MAACYIHADGALLFFVFLLVCLVLFQGGNMLSGQLYVFVITSPKVVLVSLFERSENDVGCSPHCMGKCYLYTICV